MPSHPQLQARLRAGGSKNAGQDPAGGLKLQVGSAAAGAAVGAWAVAASRVKKTTNSLGSATARLAVALIISSQQLVGDG